MKGKYIVPLILASVSATTLGAHAQFSVKADYTNDTVLSGDLIEISGFEGNGEVGKEITLPTATAQNGATVTISVTDPRGKKVELSDGSKFVPTLKGYYTVKYSATKEGQMDTVTEELRILVQGDEYSISLPTNSEHVIPATVKTNQQIKIPLPDVLENDEELTESQIVFDEENEGLKVYVVSKDDPSSGTKPLAYNPTDKTYDFTPAKAGVYEIIYRYYNGGYVQDYKTDSFVVKDNFDSSKIELNFSYKTSKPTSATLGVETTLPEIKVFDKNDSSVELDAYVTIKVTHVESGTEFTVEDYKFTPTLKGKYQVTYQASIPLFNLKSQTSTFLIEDVKDNVRPTLAVSNNYTYTTNEETGKTTINTVYRDVNKNNLYDEGTDVLLFNAADKENVNLDEKELQEKITEAIGNAKYDIPSVVVLGADGKATIKVPAIYASDNYSDFSKLTFTRSVKSSNGNITTIRKTLPDGTREDYPANEWAEYTFNSEGTYSIRFEAKDEAGNSYMDSYDVTVLTSDATLKDDEDNYLLPTLNFSAITSYAKKDATITMNQPTASDKHDTRVETRVYYSFDASNFETKNEITTLNDEGQLVLDLSKVEGITSQDKIYIHAVAYNDYAVKDGNRQYKQITREVTLINTEDGTAPKFTNADAFFTNLQTKNEITETIDNKGMITVDGKQVPAFSQKDLVKLPDFVITDTEDTNLNISVKVKNPYGKTVTLKNSTYTKEVEYDSDGTTVTNNTYTVQNGTFTADYSGVYTITYTARDAGGNIVSKSYGIRVRDTEKPTIVLSSYDPFTSAVEVGKFVEVPAATLTDSGEILTDITTNVPYESRVEGKAGTYWELVEGPSLNTMGTVGFTPSVAGDYVIKYYGWDKEGNKTESKSYTVSATDTIKPTIELEKDKILTNVPWDEEKGYVTVQAPGVLQLYDGYRDKDNSNNDYDQTPVEDITLVVKVYDKDNNQVEGVKEVEVQTGSDAYGNPINTTRYEFNAEEQGVYKITYIATDAAGNSTELSVSVNVGDTDAPEVEWVDSEKDLINSSNLNGYYEFNLDMITIDGIKGSEAIKVPENVDKADYNIVVNMYDPSSSVVKNEYADDSSKENSYRWKFEKSGTYELRITVEDKAGNPTTVSYKIVVSEDEGNTNNIKPIVGTILIIVSALILVGVVAYFVITGRKKSSTKKGSKNNKKK